MHKTWKATVQHKIFVHILYIVIEMEPTGRCGLIIGLQLRSQMYFYFFYFTVTKTTWIFQIYYSLVDLMRFHILLICVKNSKNILVFISMITKLTGALDY